MRLVLRSAPALTCAAALFGACGGAATGTAPAAAGSTSAIVAQAPQSDWPEFGLNPQRSNASDMPTGITAANVARLRRHTVQLPGVADSSPIYLHGVVVAGAAHNVFVVTTTYGRTLAIDAGGAVLWQFAPPGVGSLEGSQQITTASPIADPDRSHVYAVSPNGLVHKLALADGSEAAGWPVRVTLLPSREKIGPALNILGASILVATGGYFGDAPPYQGHVVRISRATGRITAVFNTLCANRRTLLAPSSCASSASAIWSRAGAVVEPAGNRLVAVTGNGPYDGRTNFGDSLLELDARSLHLRQAYTPANQAQLSAGDADLGSGGPALLPGKLVLIGGKDGLLRLLDLRHLNGRNVGRPFRTGGEVQVLGAPGGVGLFTEPAVWHNTVFVANGAGTVAYTLSGRRLHRSWQNGKAGSSPVVAGGLLYVYDVAGGGLNVYDPRSGQRVATLAAASGHWSSPVIAGGRIALPEGGSTADDATSGVLDLYY